MALADASPHTVSVGHRGKYTAISCGVSLQHDSLMGAAADRVAKIAFMTIALVDGHGRGHVGAALPDSFQLPSHSGITYFEQDISARMTVESEEDRTEHPWESVAPTYPPAQDDLLCPAFPDTSRASSSSACRCHSRVQSLHGCQNEFADG